MGNTAPNLPPFGGRDDQTASCSIPFLLRLDELVRTGVVADYAELARLGHVSRARISQILNLLALAPDIQESLLFLPSVERGRDPIHLWQLQPLTAILDWRQQRCLWHALEGLPRIESSGCRE